MVENTRLIELIGVSKDFDGTQALTDINLYIRKREFITLLGPSGAARPPCCASSAASSTPPRGRCCSRQGPHRGAPL